MSVVSKQPSTDRVIIPNVSWATYVGLLKDLGGRRAPRLAYDQGILEIMSPHAEHEDASWTLASIVDIVLEEVGIDSRNVGATTFKKDDQERGFQPDSCFYVQNLDRVWGKKKLDINIDPPPDLVIEVDLTNDSFNKFPLYAAMGVPEVWRFEGRLEIWILDKNQYVRHATSKVIPVVNEEIVSELMELSLTEKRRAWLRLARQRIRELNC